MAGNKGLGMAKATKQDEYYTRLCDIESEVRHYWPLFRGKVVLCNCDDPFESNFFKYFALKFNSLGLKRLVATCYDGSSVSGTQMQLFDDMDEEREKTRLAHKIVINEVRDFNGDGMTDLRDIVMSLKENSRNTLTVLDGNGDFRSKECVELLKDADIVVTNPPFSLFREYVSLLMECKKKFLVIGSKNGIKYKEVFPYIKEGKLWLGFRSLSSDMNFILPPDIQHQMLGSSKEGGKFTYDRDGTMLGRSPCAWFTNLDHKKRHENMILFRSCSRYEYPHYTNLDAIDVSCVADIPIDWPGLMGVPITFLESFNPEQFEIVGLGEGDLAKEIGVSRNHEGRTKLEYEENGVYKRPYARLVIRNRHPQKGV